MSNPFWRRRRGSGRPRRRLTGCLLWVAAIIVVLVILSLLFGGFQKGTKVGGAGAPAPVPAAPGTHRAAAGPLTAAGGGGR
jgi:hypothetical protein